MCKAARAPSRSGLWLGAHRPSPQRLTREETKTQGAELMWLRSLSVTVRILTKDSLTPSKSFSQPQGTNTTHKRQGSTGARLL
jgi:hypothetical protein